MSEDNAKPISSDRFRSQAMELRARANWEYIATEKLDMRKKWHALIGHFAVPDIAGEKEETPASNWYALLSQAYASADRHYHNVEHVGHMLSWIRYGWDGTWETCLIAQYAAWFHDAVYDSKAKDNEERSAELALNAATDLRISPDIVTPAADWILRTKTHDAAASPDCAQFLDCDLAILVAPAESYRQYAKAIGREYAWVDEDAYRAGRKQVLERFLSRTRIFITDPMAKKLETQARENLRMEMQELTMQ